MNIASASTSSSCRSCCLILLRLALLLLLVCVGGYLTVKFDNPAIVHATIREQNQAKEAFSQPYDLNTSQTKQASVTADLRYFAWQNPVLLIEAQDACISHVSVKAENALSAQMLPLGDSPVCGEVQLDLAHYLSQGNNQIAFDVSSEQEQGTPVYIAPQLFGAHIVSTLACLCLCATFLFIAYRLAGLAGFERIASFIFTLGFACYFLLLHVRPNLAYSNDLPGHIMYIRYMVDGWLHPYAYEGWEHFHPPAYYFLASRFFGLFEARTAVAPLLAVRIFALLLYMTFCFFGVRTLRESVLPSGAFYHLGVLLIVFWPMAPIVATRISNDIPVYAAWAAAFYYLSRWWREGGLKDLQYAIALMGIAFMFKTSALMLVATVGFAVLCALLMRRLAFSELFKPRMFIAYGIAILGALGNTGRLLYTLAYGGDASNYYLSPGAEEVHPTSYFLTFDIGDYIANPVVTFDKEPGFLNYFLKTMLFSEQQLGGYTMLPSIMNVLFLGFIVFTFAAAIISVTRNRQNSAVLLPFVIGALLPPVGPFIFMMLKHYMFCQSFRFIVPMLIPLLVLYVKGLQSSGKPFAAIGFICGGGILVLGLMLNFWLYSHGEFG